MSTTEATVTTKTDAFAEARASIAASEKVDDTSTPPAQETETVADEPQPTTQDTHDTLELPEEEIQKLSLKEQKVYRDLQKQYTKASQERSALQKQLDPWKPLLETLSADPQKAIEELAAQHGYTLSKAKQDTQAVEQRVQETLAELPDELQFLKPAFDSLGKKILDSVRGELAPIVEHHEHVITEAIKAETEGTLKAFEAKYKDFKQYESQMTQWMKKYVPQKGAMTDFQFMEDAYRAVTADITKAEQTKEVIEKINRAAKSAEPATPGMNASRVVHKLPPPESRDIRAAYEAAKRGERWEG